MAGVNAATMPDLATSWRAIESSAPLVGRPPVVSIGALITGPPLGASPERWPEAWEEPDRAGLRAPPVPGGRLPGTVREPGCRTRDAGATMTSGDEQVQAVGGLSVPAGELPDGPSGCATSICRPPGTPSQPFWPDPRCRPPIGRGPPPPGPRAPPPRPERNGPIAEHQRH